MKATQSIKHYILHGMLFFSFFLIVRITMQAIEIEKPEKIMLCVGFSLLYVTLSLVIENVYKYIHKDNKK